MLKRVHHIGVAVADLERASAVLRERFGLTLVREHRAPDGSSAADFYRCGEIEIELLEFRDEERRAAFLGGAELGRLEHVAIEVEDLDTTLAALAALGVQAAPAIR